MKAIIKVPAREIQAFTFDELDDNAKDVVRDWLSGDDSLVTDDVAETIQYELEKNFHDVNVSEWDLDYNYRGVSFSGGLKDATCAVVKAVIDTYSDSTARHILALMGLGYLDISINITPARRSGYRQISSEVSAYIVYPDFDLRKEAENLEDDLTAYFQDFVNDKSADAISAGQKTYDWHFSDEYVQDVCEANEYWFNKKGKPIHQLGEVVTDENA